MRDKTTARKTPAHAQTLRIYYIINSYCPSVRAPVTFVHRITVLVYAEGSPAVSLAPGVLVQGRGRNTNIDRPRRKQLRFIRSVPRRYHSCTWLRVNFISRRPVGCSSLPRVRLLFRPKDRRRTGVSQLLFNRKYPARTPINHQRKEQSPIG